MIKDIIPSLNGGSESSAGKLAAKAEGQTQGEAKKGLFGKVMESVQNALKQQDGDGKASETEVQAQEEQSGQNTIIAEDETGKSLTAGEVEEGKSESSPLEKGEENTQMLDVAGSGTAVNETITEESQPVSSGNTETETEGEDTGNRKLLTKTPGLSDNASNEKAASVNNTAMPQAGNNEIQVPDGEKNEGMAVAPQTPATLATEGKPAKEINPEAQKAIQDNDARLGIKVVNTDRLFTSSKTENMQPAGEEGRGMTKITGESKESSLSGNILSGTEQAKAGISVAGEGALVNNETGELKNDQIPVSETVSGKVNGEEITTKPIQTQKAGETDAKSESTQQVTGMLQGEETGKPADIRKREIFEKVVQPQIQKVKQTTAGTTQTVNQEGRASSEDIQQNSTDERLPGSAMKAKAAEGIPEFNFEAIHAKKQEIRDKKYRQNHYSFAGQASGNTERLNPLSESMVETQQAVNGIRFGAQANAMQNQSPGADAAPGLTDEQEMILKEQMKESVEARDQKGNESFNFGLVRLGDIPVVNMTLRRKVMPGLTQAVSKASESGKAMPGTWQQHSFELEDGNSIKLSTRNMDGVIQVKLASSSSELSKLMQQYGQEIKDHLEKECELNIDLQFENQQGQGQEMSGFFGDSSSSSGNQNGNNRQMGNFRNMEKNTGREADQILKQSVRKFGYNQMEWTV